MLRAVIYKRHGIVGDLHCTMSGLRAAAAVCDHLAGLR